MNNGPLILNFDGTLYPTSQLSMRDMLVGMEKGFDAAGLDWHRHQLPRDKRETTYGLGVFNFVQHIAIQNNLTFSQTANHMLEHIDYSRIQQDALLTERLARTMEARPVLIFTNNVETHIRNILLRRLSDTMLAMEIPVTDITSTLGDDGRFHGKPNPLGFYRILAKNGWKAEECTVADDLSVNVTAAQAIGMRGILIENADLSPVLSR